MPLKRITAAAQRPISREEVKANLNVGHSDDDTLIDGLIDAATAHIEAYYGLLVEQTWELSLDRFPYGEIAIPLRPLISVESVRYDDGSGDEQTIASEDYTVDAVSSPGWVLPGGSRPSTFNGVNAVRIRFKAGYPIVGGKTTTPYDIKQAMHLLVGHWYRNREAVVIGQTVASLPMAVDALLAPYRDLRI